MVCGMPVLSGDFEDEREREEVVDGGDYRAAVGDCEAAVLWLIS